MELVVEPCILGTFQVDCTCGRSMSTLNWSCAEVARPSRAGLPVALAQCYVVWLVLTLSMLPRRRKTQVGRHA